MIIGIGRYGKSHIVRTLPDGWKRTYRTNLLPIYGVTKIEAYMTTLEKSDLFFLCQIVSILCIYKACRICILYILV